MRLSLCFGAQPGDLTEAHALEQVCGAEGLATAQGDKLNEASVECAAVVCAAHEFARHDTVEARPQHHDHRTRWHTQGKQSRNVSFLLFCLLFRCICVGCFPSSNGDFVFIAENRTENGAVSTTVVTAEHGDKEGHEGTEVCGHVWAAVRALLGVGGVVAARCPEDVAHEAPGCAL